MKTAYHTIFDGYVKELRAAHDEAQLWWHGLLAAAAADPAAEDPRLRWPCGPVSHP
jgi:hypothetical protein